jgi:hypothetical protein
VLDGCVAGDLASPATRRATQGNLPQGFEYDGQAAVLLVADGGRLVFDARMNEAAPANGIGLIVPGVVLAGRAGRDGQAKAPCRSNQS